MSPFDDTSSRQQAEFWSVVSGSPRFQTPPISLACHQLALPFTPGWGFWQCPCSHHHVLRITIQNAANVVLLKLEGSVKGPWVEELRKAWLASAKLADGEPVSVDLGAVSFIDLKGRDLLLRMRREGVALKGGSSFLLHILEDGNANSKQFKKDRRSI